MAAPVRFRTIVLVIELFDANCALGMISRPGPAGAFLSADDLAAHQARYGIGNALVYHSLAREEHPMAGNELLMQAIDDHDTFQASWLALPHHTGEFPEPARFLEELRAARVRAVRIFPDEHHFLVDAWVSGDLLSALAGQVPLFWHIDRLDTPTARDLHRVATAHPDLQIVICDVDKMINRTITPLMRQSPNLWLDTSGYRTHRGVEYLSNAVGADRLVFGTQLPWQAVGPPHAELMYADIDNDARQAIGASNLERLLAMAAW